MMLNWLAFLFLSFSIVNIASFSQSLLLLVLLNNSKSSSSNLRNSKSYVITGSFPFKPASESLKSDCAEEGTANSGYVGVLNTFIWGRAVEEADSKYFYSYARGVVIGIISSFNLFIFVCNGGGGIDSTKQSLMLKSLTWGEGVLRSLYLLYIGVTLRYPSSSCESNAS